MDQGTAQIVVNFLMVAVMLAAAWRYRQLDRRIGDLEEFIRWASMCEDCRKEEEEARLKSREQLDSSAGS